MINSQIETIITLAAAARLVLRRRAGKKCSISTLYRWTGPGCRGTVLESIQIGATRCTSEEALSRFFQNLTTAGNRAEIAEPSRKPAADLRRTKRIDQELDKLGLA